MVAEILRSEYLFNTGLCNRSSQALMIITKFIYLRLAHKHFRQYSYRLALLPTPFFAILKLIFEPSRGQLPNVCHLKEQVERWSISKILTMIAATKTNQKSYFISTGKAASHITFPNGSQLTFICVAPYLIFCYISQVEKSAFELNIHSPVFC